MLVFYTPDLLFAALCFLTEFFDNITNTQKAKSHAGVIILPTYGFEVSSDDGGVFRMVPMGTNDPDFSSARVLQAEGSVSLFFSVLRCFRVAVIYVCRVLKCMRVITW